MKMTVRFIVLLSVAVFFAGCGAKIKPQARIVLPPPPDEPRLELIGVFYSDKSFKGGGTEASIVDRLTGNVVNTAFTGPAGIASNGDGLVYVSDMYRSKVYVYDFNEKTVYDFTSEPKFARPTHLALDSKGNLYIADTKNGAVYAYSPSGIPLQTYAGDGTLTNVSGIAISPDDTRLYASDGSRGSKVVAFDRETAKVLFEIGGWGGPQPGYFKAPQGLAFGPEGNLYVADSLNARVQVFTPGGELVRVVGERGDGYQMEAPSSIAFDSEGHMYVVEGRRSAITIYNQEGAPHFSLGAKGATTSALGFSGPRQVFIDQNDRIYVADMINKRFVVWQYMDERYQASHPLTPEDLALIKKTIEENRRKADAARKAKPKLID